MLLQNATFSQIVEAVTKETGRTISKGTISGYKDKLVAAGRLESKTKHQYGRNRKPAPEPVEVSDSIAARIAAVDHGGPMGRAKRMSATMEEAYHRVAALIGHEADRIRSDASLSERDRRDGIKSLSTEMRRLLSLAAAIAVGNANDLQSLTEVAESLDVDGE
jgi:hypothetical protein